MKLLTLFLLFLSQTSAFGACKAIIFSGGYEPKINYKLHLEQVGAFYKSLIAAGCAENDITILSASGDKTGLDFTPTDFPNGNTKFVSGDYSFLPNSKEIFPANLSTLTKKISEIDKSSTSGDQIFVTILDHGSKTSGISGWRSDILPFELQNALSQIHSGAKLKVWTECCYCGMFNSMKLANGCVATSTDSGHVGDYNYSGVLGTVANFFGFTKSAIQNKFANAIVDNGKVRSFEDLANISKLQSNDPAFGISKSKKYGDLEIDPGICTVGPRNSYDAYIYATIGLDNGPVCYEDFIKSLGTAIESADTCPADSGKPSSSQHQLNFLEDILGWLDKDQSNASELTKLRVLSAHVESDIKNSDEQKKIENLDLKFSKLSSDAQFAQGSAYQTEAQKLKQSLYDNVGVKFKSALEESWAAVLKKRFNEIATPAQQAHLGELKNCFQEALF